MRAPTCRRQALGLESRPLALWVPGWGGPAQTQGPAILDTVRRSCPLRGQSGRPELMGAFRSHSLGQRLVLQIPDRPPSPPVTGPQVQGIGTQGRRGLPGCTFASPPPRSWWGLRGRRCKAGGCGLGWPDRPGGGTFPFSSPQVSGRWVTEPRSRVRSPRKPAQWLQLWGIMGKPEGPWSGAGLPCGECGQ